MASTKENQELFEQSTLLKWLRPVLTNVNEVEQSVRVLFCNCSSNLSHRSHRRMKTMNNMQAVLEETSQAEASGIQAAGLSESCLWSRM